MCKVIMLLQSDEHNIFVTECNEQLDRISLLKHTKDNIKFYAEELLPRGTRFKVYIYVYMNDTLLQCQYYSCFLLVDVGHFH